MITMGVSDSWGEGGAVVVPAGCVCVCVHVDVISEAWARTQRNFVDELNQKRERTGRIFDLSYTSSPDTSHPKAV